MKKLLSLITLLACAGSLYAAGAGTLTPSSVGFESNEGYAADTVISNTLQEAGNTEGNYQWWSAGSDEGETGTIKLYNVAAEPPAEEGGEEATPASETEAGLPKYNYGEQNVGNFVNLGSGDQYLNVETTTGKPLYRTLATWNNNFLWVKTNENGEKEIWDSTGDPDPAEQGTVWQKEYQVNSLADIAGVEIGSEGKVIDTLVQFTASETAPELADGDKLVVWLKQQTEDDKPTDWQDQIKVDTKYTYTWTDQTTEVETNYVHQGDEALSAEEMETKGIPAGTEPKVEDVIEANVWPCFTNLMVTAGQLASDGTVDTNTFTISANEGVLPDKWYRLTIRAIENVTTYNSKQSGFAIYLDGVAVKCLDNDYESKLLNDFDVANLSSTAKGLYDNKELFISAVSATSGASVLTAVGFDGTGKIDDLTINTVEAGPQFAMGKRIFKVEWDNGLTGFTIVAKGSDGNDITNETFSVEGGAVAKEFDFAAGAETYVISNLAFASGSKLSEVTATGATMAETSGVYSFTGLDFAPVVKIGVDTVLATVDGTEYSNFADAIAAATNGVDGTTLELAADITLDGTSICVENEDDVLVIDLKGHNILYANPQEDANKGGYYPMFYVVDGKLTIKDSVGGGVVGFATEEDLGTGAYLVDGLKYNEPVLDENGEQVYKGQVIIGDQTDKGATFDGIVNGSSKIWSGKFDYVANSSPFDADGNVTDLWEVWTFIEEPAVVESSELVASEEKNEEGVPLYWVVTQGDTPVVPEPTDPVITINVADATNATVTVDGVAYNAGATYKYTGTPVVIVATAFDGFTYTGVTAEGWTIAGDGTTATNTVSGITADVTVNVPAALVKAPEGPTRWEDVDGDTEVSNVVNTATYEALTNANANSMVTAVDIKTWALKHNVSFATGGILVSAEALMLNCADNPTAIAAAKDDFKVDGTIFNQIMANLTDLTKVNFSTLATTYPCAAFRVKEVMLGEGEPSENAKFYKLEMTLK